MRLQTFFLFFLYLQTFFSPKNGHLPGGGGGEWKVEKKKKKLRPPLHGPLTTFEAFRASAKWVE